MIFVNHRKESYKRERNKSHFVLFLCVDIQNRANKNYNSILITPLYEMNLV